MASSGDSPDLTELTPAKLVGGDGEETDVKVPYSQRSPGSLGLTNIVKQEPHEPNCA